MFGMGDISSRGAEFPASVETQLGDVKIVSKEVNFRVEKRCRCIQGLRRRLNGVVRATRILSSVLAGVEEIQGML